MFSVTFPHTCVACQVVFTGSDPAAVTMSAVVKPIGFALTGSLRTSPRQWMMAATLLWGTILVLILMCWACGRVKAKWQDNQNSRSYILCEQSPGPTQQQLPLRQAKGAKNWQWGQDVTLTKNKMIKISEEETKLTSLVLRRTPKALQV